MGDYMGGAVSWRPGGDPPPNRVFGASRDLASDEQRAVNRQVQQVHHGRPETAQQEQERLIEAEVQRRRVSWEAKRRFDAEQVHTVDLPPMRTLTDFLAETTEPAPWRIEGLLQQGGNVLLNAKAKAGKTTLMSNLLRSLVDGDQFLDRFAVRPTERAVTLLDFELPEETLREWLRTQQVHATDALNPLSLKGMAAKFDVRRDDLRARWAEALSNTDVLVLDALAPLLSALNLSEATEAGDLLPALDALKAEAGISELIVVHHQGHATERARGDSRLEGWPDSIVTLNIGDGDVRYLSARGRDVDLAETALAFDATTKRLSMATGSRRDAGIGAALDAVLDVLQLAGEPLQTWKIEEAVEGHPRESVRQALKSGMDTGVLMKQTGARGAHLWALTSPVRGTSP